MNVKKLSFINVDLLYDGTLNKQNAENFNTGMFGRNFPQFLSNIAVTLNLTDVTYFEYLFLKLYCSSVSEPTFYSTEEDGKTSFSDIFDSAIVPIKGFVKSLEESFGTFYDSLLIPPGLRYCDVDVVMSGHQVTYIFGLDPETAFSEITEKDCIDENGKLKPNYDIMNHENFDNYVIKTFINKFYKFMMDRITYKDLISDGLTHNYFLNNNKVNTAIMKYIINPNCLVDMSEDKAKMIESFKTYKELSKGISYTLKQTKISFSMNTYFATFIDLMTIFPVDRFVSLESFNIITATYLDTSIIPECPEPIKGKFYNRYVGRTTSLIEEIQRNYNTEENKVKRYELTSSYIPFRFVLSLQMTDVDDYIDPYLNGIKPYSFMCENTCEILKSIKSSIMNIFKLMK